jgi:hypothetical protein
MSHEKPPARTHQLEVLQSMAELMDSLPTTEMKREVLAFLAVNAGLIVKDPPARTGSGYRFVPKRKS